MKNTLIHYGILGQKWGIRRFQNADGSLTAAGKERYGRSSSAKSLKTGGEDYLIQANKKRR